MEILNTKSLPSIASGLLEAAIDDALYKVFKDLEDRPGMNKPRTVSIQLTFKPAAGERRLDNGVPVDKTSDLEAADISFAVDHKLPKHQFNRRMMALSRNNGFGFESDTNSIKFHPNQQPLGFPDEDSAVVE